MCVECSLALSEDVDNAAEVENKKHFLIASDKTQHTYITYPPVPVPAPAPVSQAPTLAHPMGQQMKKKKKI